MARVKQEDFLYSSARVRALERTLLNRERMERLIDAASQDDAARLLQDCGYDPEDISTSDGIETMLRKKREDTYSLLEHISPSKELIEEVQIPMDYHNLKVYLKAEAQNEDAASLYSNNGRVAADKLTQCLRTRRLKDLPEDMMESYVKASELLHKTGDPQEMDFYLDSQCQKAQEEVARKSKSKFMIGLSKLKADSANLRILVRCARLKKEPEFVEKALLTGGNVSVERLIRAYAADLKSAFARTGLEEAAELGDKVKVGDGSLTAFEREVDNAQIRYLRISRRISYGPEPILAYLLAREEELKSVRTILTGNLYQVDAAVTRERLRDAYVQ